MWPVYAKVASLEKKVEAALPIKDPTGSPGPKALKSGTLELGYFGFTFADELITGNALAAAIGLSTGTAQNSDAGWLKWVNNNKIMFVARKTFRSTVNWTNIDAVGAVFGSKTISIGGKTYKVRLLTGGNASPASSAGGEWDIIMYGVHKDEAPGWEQLSDASLLVHSDYGNGSLSWCQEARAGIPTDHILRGGGTGGVQNYSSGGTGTTAAQGWRPVLELVN